MDPKPTGLESLRSASPGPASGAVPPPRSRWKTRLLLPGAILLCVLLLLAYTLRGSLTSARLVEVVPVVVRQTESAAGKPPKAPGAPGSAGAVAQAPGWIEADPFPITVSALTDGVVREVLALEGQRVAKGEAVARLIDEDAKLAVRSAEASLARTRAELAVAAAELEGAERARANPIEKRAAVAVSESELATARAEAARGSAEVAAAEARAAETRDELTRKRTLQDSGAISAGELARLELRLHAEESMTTASIAGRDASQAAVAVAQARAEGARAALDLLIEETRDETTARAAHAAAQATVTEAEAALAQARLALERTEIVAPADGVVQSRLVEVGSRLMSQGADPEGSTVLRLYDPAHLQARTDIPLSEAFRVSIGQRAEISSDAIPGRTFSGRVVRTVQLANIEKNTVQVKVAIEAPDERLRPDTLVRVRFLAMESGDANSAAGPGAAESSTGAVFAPAAALKAESPTSLQATVWIVDRDGDVAALRKVSLATTLPPSGSQDWVEVLDGLRPGDRVIVSDTTGLSAGERLRAVEKAMQSPEGDHP